MSVRELNSKAEFDALLSSTPFVAIEAGAVWCGPCRAIGPMFDKHAKDLAIPEKYVFAKFDLDNNPDIAAELGIRAVPAFFFFESGEKTNTFTGANPQALHEAVSEFSSKAKA